MNGQVNITGINLELTEAIKNYVREKATKLFEHNDRIIRANFDLEYIPTKAPEQSFVAKSTIEIAGPNIVLSVTSADLYKSIDELMDKLIRQIRRAHRLEKESATTRRTSTSAKIFRRRSSTKPRTAGIRQNL
ncbi:MAG: ribosome-associated translation inhibitor RaiA [Opitutales bacterium]|nr:ribosome-associated translation inhibitor RaiA [Opitutales bacterium]